MTSGDKGLTGPVGITDSAEEVEGFTTEYEGDLVFREILELETGWE